LRQHREHRALMELQNRNQFRDTTSEALTQLRGRLEQEHTTMRREEKRRYESLVGHALPSGDVAAAVFTIDKTRSRIDLLRDRGKQLQAVVQQAISDASEAKAAHANHYKADRKWSKIVDDSAAESQAKEDQDLEIANEDLRLIKPEA